MNTQQMMFHDNFMDMVQTEKKQEAEAVLAVGFERQAEGTFDVTYLQSTIMTYCDLVRPECMDRLRQVVSYFVAQL